MKALAFISGIFKKFPLPFAASTFLLLVANLMDAASIFSLVVIVDLFINPNLQNASFVSKYIIQILKGFGLNAGLGWLLVFFLSFNILKVSFQIFAQYVILKIKYALLRNIIMGTFEDFFASRWYFFSSNKQGVLFNTFIREMNVVGDAISAMARYSCGILQILLYLIVPLYLSWQVTLVTLSAALLFALPFFLIGKLSYRLGKLNTSTANQVSSVIHESLNLAKLILGFAKQKESMQALSNAFEGHRKATLRSQLLNFSMPLLYFPFGLLVLIIGLLVAQRLTLPIAQGAVLFYALARLIPLISSLTGDKSTLDNFFPSYEQITKLRQEALKLKQPTGLRDFKGFETEINIENVSLSYPGGEPILRNINMRIPKGKMVAVAGESGAGKSTLIDMLMGFHEPILGSISFDGVSLKEFNIYSYRGRLGYVGQDSVLFNLSIRDNLRWANEASSNQEIIHACRQANAQEFIEELPHGYDTIVGDRGVRLSGGQIQRIALARAILRRPDLLILDEATSALDTYSERLIQGAIESIAKETTVIVIAHRLSTIKNAECIYVLGGGGIPEQGSYKELMQKKGYFNKMAQLQILEVA